MGGTRAEILGISRQARHAAVASLDVFGGGDPPGTLGIEDSQGSRNRRLAQRQQKLDTDTSSGSKPGVPYGDVILDISTT